MADYEKPVIHGITASGDKKAILVGADGGLGISVGDIAITSADPSKSPTSTLTNVASSATSVTILAANENRKTVIIANDSTAILYLKFNAGVASTSSYTVALAPLSSGIPATVTLKGEDYSGEIRGIWASANGFARVTEIV